MSEPQVSIAMTVYNRERFLADAIESVLQQQGPTLELILWDDGSSNGSRAIARHYARQDGRVRLFEAEHRGRGPALRAATLQATGRYLGVVDSDDQLEPLTLARTVEMLEQNPEVGMVYTDYRVMDETGQLKGDGQRCRIPYSKERLLLDFMTFHFRLMRRTVVEVVGGFNPQFQAAQDYDLCLRLSEVTEIRHCPASLYRYRVHRQTISHPHQLEQIHWTAEAIAQALQRRGLAEQVELQVQLQPRFILRHKATCPSLTQVTAPVLAAAAIPAPASPPARR
jgi:glycosyltransferase involved in cell wall biosynthesis